MPTMHPQYHQAPRWRPKSHEYIPSLSKQSTLLPLDVIPTSSPVPLSTVAQPSDLAGQSPFLHRLCQTLPGFLSVLFLSRAVLFG